MEIFTPETNDINQMKNMKNILFSLLFVALVISFTSCTKDTIIKKKADSDDLGQKELRFSDYIITSSAANSYALNYYSTGSLVFIIVPQSLVK